MNFEMLPLLAMRAEVVGELEYLAALPAGTRPDPGRMGIACHVLVDDAGLLDASGAIGQFLLGPEEAQAVEQVARLLTRPPGEIDVERFYVGTVAEIRRAAALCLETLGHPSSDEIWEIVKRELERRRADRR